MNKIPTQDALSTRRRSLLWKIPAAFAGLFAFSLAVIYLFVPDIDITVSEADVQAKLNEQLGTPIQRLGTEIVPRQLSIDFTADNRAVLTAELDMTGFNRAANLTGQYKTGIRYVSPKFYLENIHPLSLNLKYDESTAQEVSDIERVLRDKFLRERNEIGDQDTSAAFDRLTKRNEERIKTAAASAAQSFFTSIPIYDLRSAGMEGSVARLALADLRFAEDVTVVTLSPRLAVIKVISTILIILLIIFWALIRYPYISKFRIRKFTNSDGEDGSG